MGMLEVRKDGKGKGEGRGRTVNSGSLDNVDVVELVLDLDGDDVVGLVDHLCANISTATIS